VNSIKNNMTQKIVLTPSVCKSFKICVRIPLPKYMNIAFAYVPDLRDAISSTLMFDFINWHVFCSMFQVVIGKWLDLLHGWIINFTHFLINQIIKFLYPNILFVLVHSLQPGNFYLIITQKSCKKGSSIV
jgi:hypothetical protein